MSAGIIVPKPLRVRYDSARCWFVEVPFPHPDSAVLSAMAYALKANRQRLAGMPPGDRREACAGAVKALAAALASRRPIAQVVPTTKADVPLVYDIDARKAARGGIRG